VHVYVDLRDVPKGSITGTGVYAMELVRHLPRSVEVVASGGEVYHRPSQIYDRAALDAFLGTPARKVITYLDLISYRTPALFATSELHQQYRALSMESLQGADAVLAISEYGRREIVEEFALPPDRVHAVHLGVDAAFFDRPAPRPRSAPYFLCTGSDYPHKNLPLLLRSYAWLRARWPEAPELVLVGHRTKAPGIYELGHEPAPGVRYLGELERHALPALYQHAAAFVYPSTYEGFGLPILEAMAAGTPVVCARLTSVPEVAGEAALYLDELSMDELADRMRAAASDSALRARLIEAGRERAKRFTWEETARRTAEVYALKSSRTSFGRTPVVSSS
jgi:glycosyltransferase involved in cell wall biosynthesis